MRRSRRRERAEEVGGKDDEPGRLGRVSLGYNPGQFYTFNTVDRPMDLIFPTNCVPKPGLASIARKAMLQTVEISLQIGGIDHRGRASDDIRDTVDYAVVVERLRADLAASATSTLPEKAAEHIATWLLDGNSMSTGSASRSPSQA